MQQTDTELNTSPAITDAEMNQYFDSKGEDVPERLLEEVVEPDVELPKEIAPVEPEIDIKQLKGAMHEERERRKEYQRQLQEQGHELSQVKTQFQQVVEYLRQAQGPKEPTFDEDPLGAMAHQIERQRQAIEYQQAIEAQRHQTQQQTQNMQQFQTTYANDAKQFMQQNTDFGDAYKYLFQSRMNELTKLGYNQQQAQYILIEDEMASVSKAYQDGVNPAERLYEVAKLRGYLKAAPAKQAQDKIKEMARAKESATSLSNSSGSKSGASGLTIEAILAMDDDEFNKLTPAQWKKANGG